MAPGQRPVGRGYWARGRRLVAGGHGVPLQFPRGSEDAEWAWGLDGVLSWTSVDAPDRWAGEVSGRVMERIKMEPSGWSRRDDRRSARDQLWSRALWLRTRQEEGGRARDWGKGSLAWWVLMGVVLALCVAQGRWDDGRRLDWGGKVEVLVGINLSLARSGSSAGGSASARLLFLGGREAVGAETTYFLSPSLSVLVGRLRSGLWSGEPVDGTR